jgi:TusA-related sulfurtransferase
LVSAGAVAIDGGELPLGGGLLALLRPALDALEPGGVVALRSAHAGVRQDLPSWCRVERHEYLGCERDADGCDRHLIRRGRFGVPRPTDEAPPDEADPSTGFAPRGARVEPGGPLYPVTLTRLALAAPPETRALYDQAVAAQWDARALPWDRVRPLPPALERALGQVMTFLAENELSALYVPSKFVSRLHPAYADTAMFLATQLMDEARHIDVFLRRARAGGGGLGISSVTTSRSLLFLLTLEDFAEAAFLLSVLGEGTFLDLLRFVEEHAPDEVTADLARRARADEARHVHFGVAHVRHALAHDPSLASRLEAAVARRSATLHGIDGVPAPIADALTILAARGDDPPSVARGHQAFRGLLDEMHQARKKRLEHAGFSAAQAERISALHTPNFM